MSTFVDRVAERNRDILLFSVLSARRGKQTGQANGVFACRFDGLQFREELGFAFI
jgi:hypothetical protein